MSSKKQLPTNAKKVFQGEIYAVYQWPQKMFDGSTATFERLKRPDTAEIIALVGDKLLIQKQEQPHKGAFVSLPGGRCDQGESHLAAAKRELLEETGYVSSSWKLWRQYQSFNTIIWSSFVYLARDCRYQQAPKVDAGERITNKLISFQEFLLLSENNSFRHSEIRLWLYYLRFHPQEQKQFAKLLFGKR